MRVGGTPAHTDQRALHPTSQLVFHAGDRGPGPLRAAHELPGLGRDMVGVPSAKPLQGSGEKMAPTPRWTQPSSLTIQAGSNLENHSWLGARQVQPTSGHLYR